jgi:Holliday junction resolvase RusA-like endonuclease
MTRPTGEIAVQVRGVKPKAWGNKEMEWRLAVAGEARHLVRPVDVDDLAEFRVEATFYLMPQDAWTTVDLDNLAKPLLDTLFRTRHPQMPEAVTGSLFEIDDGRVMELILRKRVVEIPSEEGVDVLVGWVNPSRT